MLIMTNGLGSVLFAFEIVQYNLVAVYVKISSNQAASLDYLR
jgi:hypothetical protein